MSAPWTAEPSAPSPDGTPCSNILRMATPNAVPPGSRVTTHSRPCDSTYARNRSTCVVLPTPSTPSNEINMPCIVITVPCAVPCIAAESWQNTARFRFSGKKWNHVTSNHAYMPPKHGFLAVFYTWGIQNTARFKIGHQNQNRAASIRHLYAARRQRPAFHTMFHTVKKRATASHAVSAPEPPTDGCSLHAR